MYTHALGVSSAKAIRSRTHRLLGADPEILLTRTTRQLWLFSGVRRRYVSDMLACVCLCVDWMSHGFGVNGWLCPSAAAHTFPGTNVALAMGVLIWFCLGEDAIGVNKLSRHSRPDEATSVNGFCSQCCCTLESGIARRRAKDWSPVLPTQIHAWRVCGTSATPLTLELQSPHTRFATCALHFMHIMRKMCEMQLQRETRSVPDTLHLAT